MKMIAMIAAAATTAMLCLPTHAEPFKDWKTISVKGINYRISLGSIKRKTMDHADLPTGAQILVYRDDGGPPDDEAFFTMVFDCTGHFMLWHHPEDTRRINPDSMASQLEDVACWGSPLQ
jgi:hypothetical protein